MSEQVDARCLTCGAPIAKGPGLCDDCAGRPPVKKKKDLAWGFFGCFMVVLFGLIMLGASHHDTSSAPSPAPAVTTPPASQAAPRPKPEPSAPAAEAPIDFRVQDIQLSLVSAGEQNVTVSGHMDAATKAAIKHFQRQHGLTPDGVVGPQTQKALTAAQPSRPTPPPTGCAAAPVFT
jgi:hypothetical protein